MSDFVPTEIRMRDNPESATLDDIRWAGRCILNKMHADREIEQILGQALGCPWYKDDPKNFPDSTEEDGVCVGEHVPETLAIEAAKKIRDLEDKLSSYKFAAGAASTAVARMANTLHEEQSIIRNLENALELCSKWTTEKAAK